MSFADLQREDISPICGCFLPHANWRGISFTSHNLTLTHQNSAPKMGHLFLAPVPAPISLAGSLGFNAHYYVLNIPYGMRFNPHTLLDPNGNISYTIVKEKSFEAIDSLFLVTDTNASTNIMLLGDKPISAWIPAEGATTTVSYRKSDFVSEYPRLQIEEQDTPTKNPSAEGMPLGDFLGPTVFWTQDQSAVLSSSDTQIHIDKSNNNAQIVAALVINAPFSVRMIVAPIDKETVEQAGQVFYVGHRNGGVVTLGLDDSINPAEYGKLLDSIKRQEVVWVPLGSKGNKGTIGMRYPPLPPTPTINIFGPMSSLKLLSATGTFMVGAHSIDAQAPSDIELRDIHVLEPVSTMLQVPVQYDVADKSVKTLFKGVSVVSVNGQTIDTKTDFYIELAQLLQGIAALVSLVVGIWAFYKGVKSNKIALAESHRLPKRNSAKAVSLRARDTK